MASDTAPPHASISLIREGKAEQLAQLLADEPAENIEVIRVLLAAGAKPLHLELGEPRNATLATAVVRGNRSVVRVLLDALPSAAQIDSSFARNGEPEADLLARCLFQAATFGHHLVLRDLLEVREYSHFIICQTLLAAVTRWEAEAVELIVGKFKFEQAILRKALALAVEEKKGIEAENPYEEEYYDDDPGKQARLVAFLLDTEKVDLRMPAVGSPLLREAIFRSEQQGALKVLLDRGADPDTTWEDGKTSLHLLACPHYPPMPFLGPRRDAWVNEAGIRLFLAKGASIDIKDDYGQTATCDAAEHAFTDTFLRFFLPRSDSEYLFRTNKYRETMLHRAAAGGKYDTVKYLLEQGCFDVNATNPTGWTPLICALAPNELAMKSETMAVETARLLLDFGADPSVKTLNGWTILHCLGSYPNRGPPKESLPSETEEDLPEYSPDEDEDDWHYEEEPPDIPPLVTAAADLLRELLSGPSKLPPIHSPARVLYDGPKEKYGLARSGPYQIYTRHSGWGGRLDDKLVSPASPAEADRPVTVIEGLTPLHWAAEHGATGVVAVLREVGGADVEALDSMGGTAWDAARRSLWWWAKDLLDATKEALEASRAGRSRFIEYKQLRVVAEFGLTTPSFLRPTRRKLLIS